MSSMNLRNCLRDPPPAIFEAAEFLKEAENAHLSGNRERASELLRQANMPVIREWTESLWGKNNGGVVQVRSVDHPTPVVPKTERDSRRMPGPELRRALIARDGYACRFCGIPLVPASVRARIHSLYPNARIWGRRNVDQHAALQAMWVQFDHVLPWTRGGRTSFENLIITCAPCNFARMEHTIEEVGLLPPGPPRARMPDWTGLIHFK